MSDRDPTHPPAATETAEAPEGARPPGPGSIDRGTLLALLEIDDHLYEELCEAGALARDRQRFERDEAEHARVACTLVRELEVNWPGVEIILRMRRELVATRQQVSELLAFLRRQG